MEPKQNPDHEPNDYTFYEMCSQIEEDEAREHWFHEDQVEGCELCEEKFKRIGE